MITKKILIDSLNFLDEVIDKTLENDYIACSFKERHLFPYLFFFVFFSEKATFTNALT